MIIGVLGPEGSYSEKAAKAWARKIGPGKIELQYFDDIEDAFNSAASGKVDVAVVPIENSIEGSVGVTLDLLREDGTVIKGEIVEKIEHCLLSKGNLKTIKVVLSHPQGLAQCRHFLKLHFPEAELRTTGSTSHAARLAGEFEEMAAIASPEAAERYGLKILLSNIQDRKENYTRFIVVQKADAGERDFLNAGPKMEPCASDLPDSASPDSSSSPNSPDSSKPLRPFKTSILVYLEKDRPGALYEFLEGFARLGINLLRIESRPSKKELGDYLFYIDIEGHISDALIMDALKDIKRKNDMLKVLGSYPVYPVNM